MWLLSHFTGCQCHVPSSGMLHALCVSAAGSHVSRTCIRIIIVSMMESMHTQTGLRFVLSFERVGGCYPTSCAWIKLLTCQLGMSPSPLADDTGIAEHWKREPKPFLLSCGAPVEKSSMLAMYTIYPVPPAHIIETELSRDISPACCLASSVSSCSSILFLFCPFGWNGSGADLIWSLLLVYYLFQRVSWAFLWLKCGH